MISVVNAHLELLNRSLIRKEESVGADNLEDHRRDGDAQCGQHEKPRHRRDFSNLERWNQFRVQKAQNNCNEDLPQPIRRTWRTRCVVAHVAQDVGTTSMYTVFNSNRFHCQCVSRPSNSHEQDDRVRHLLPYLRVSAPSCLARHYLETLVSESQFVCWRKVSCSSCVTPYLALLRRYLLVRILVLPPGIASCELLLINSLACSVEQRSHDDNPYCGPPKEFNF